MRGKGTLTAWNDEKGFGFIEPFSGGARLFIPIRDFDRKRARWSPIPSPLTKKVGHAP